MMTFRQQLLQLIGEAQKIHREEKSLTMRSLKGKSSECHALQARHSFPTACVQ